MKTVIVDIDGTVADLTHRRHFLPDHGKDKNWQAFFDAMKDDKPIWPVINLVLALQRTWHEIVFVSGRPDSHRQITMDWLIDRGLIFFDLRMRKAGDYRSDVIVKKEILDQLIAEGHDIAFVIDDRESLVSMWRANGLVCLQAAPGDFDKPKYPSGKLHMLIGPSGAGKSTLAEDFGFPVVSSDEIRRKLCGNILDQTKNEQVFAAVHAIVKAHIDNGLDVVVDATNLRNRDRRALRELCNKDTQIYYYVINRSMEEKNKTAGWRNELPLKDGKTLIQRHEEIFNSNLKDILAGDNDKRVTVIDLRKEND